MTIPQIWTVLILQHLNKHVFIFWNYQRSFFAVQQLIQDSDLILTQILRYLIVSNIGHTINIFFVLPLLSIWFPKWPPDPWYSTGDLRSIFFSFIHNCQSGFRISKRNPSKNIDNHTINIFFAHAQSSIWFPKWPPYPWYSTGDWGLAFARWYYWLCDLCPRCSKNAHK